MKDIYVNSDGVICACTVEVPVEPYASAWDLTSPSTANETIGKVSESKSALQACKDSAVPFEDQDAAWDFVWRHDVSINGPLSLFNYRNTICRKDSFRTLSIEADWDIVEVPEYPIDHTSYPPMKKFARLKVPAPYCSN